MNPKNCLKVRKKARAILIKDPNEVSTTQVLDVLRDLLQSFDFIQFERERLSGQASHWRNMYHQEAEEKKAILHTIREAESEAKRQKDLALEQEKERARKKEEALRKEKEEVWKNSKKKLDELKACSEEEKRILIEEYETKLDEAESSASNAKAELEKIKEEKGKIEGQLTILKNSLNKDSHNSSKPSSTNGFKKIPNNRKPSDRPCGGQMGHPSTKRELYVPDHILFLDDSPFRDNPERYKDTGRTKVKQLVRLKFVIEVDQVQSGIFYDRLEKREVTAPFPRGMHSELTYDASLKAFCMLLHTWGNVSYDKTSFFLNCISRGRVNIAKSTLSGMEKKFSSLTVSQREEITSQLLSQPYLHVDATPVSVNGKLMCVLAVCCPQATHYYFSEHKGNEAAEKTALRFYLGILIHDGEATFFKYGKQHQCCCEHELRSLVGISESEPDLTWAKAMHDHIQKMIHTAHEALKQGMDKLPEETAEHLLQEYERLLELGRREYEENPKIAEYSVDGVRTLRRLEKNKESLTLFLHDLSIPPTNNPCETQLRKVKMSRKQNGGFRSTENAGYYCDTMTVLETERQAGGNVMDKLTNVMDKGTAAVLDEMIQEKAQH